MPHLGVVLVPRMPLATRAFMVIFLEVSIRPLRIQIKSLSMVKVFRMRRIEGSRLKPYLGAARQYSF
jgi:hypothetical protein